jgi:bifunctional DNA-binding transcriptional regulator/antitoxin component of YhaV-PrlF toxin-antitoxin module
VNGTFTHAPVRSKDSQGLSVGTVLCIPTIILKWYYFAMSNNVSHSVALGDRGRFVIPIEVRDRHGWGTGASLIAVDTDAGLIVMSTDEALTWLQSRLDGRDLVAELLAERRAEVERENA